MELQRKQRIKQLEELIAQGEQRVSELEQEMTQEDVFSDYQKMAEKCTELEELKAKISSYTDEWLDLAE